jgi:hypothetical protein
VEYARRTFGPFATNDRCAIARSHRDALASGRYGSARPQSAPDSKLADEANWDGICSFDPDPDGNLTRDFERKKNALRAVFKLPEQNVKS